MKITDCIVRVRKHVTKARFHRDALHTYPGAGTVEVEIRTDRGDRGTGEVSIYRITASPTVLAAVIREELTPIVLGRDPSLVRQIREEMLRETEYHGPVGWRCSALLR